MNKLQEIFDYKQVELAQRMSVNSLAEMKQRATDAPPTRGFLEALRQSPHSVALIAEVKRASPSAGVIRTEFDPAEIARSYARAGADCLSVLTDEKYFGGSETNLALCREVTALPILRKDFTSDPYHIYEARAMAADAILLIVAGLSSAQVREYRELAEELGMDALVEVHSQEEADIAIHTGAKLIGVNNRDLATFEISLQTTADILPFIPAGILAVSESGLDSNHGVESVARAGARAVLIGTAFCRSDDIEGEVRKVMGWP